MDEREIIRQMYRDYWTYMINKDAAGLRSLMAEDYYLQHMTGVQQSREEFLRGLAGGTFNYYSADHDSIEGEMAQIAELNRGVRYYTRTEEALAGFAAWRPAFEEK